MSTKYPDKAQLKVALKQECSSDAMCETLASKFGGIVVSCNHRVPQKAAFDAVNSSGASTEDAATCAKILCSYVNVAQCGIKKP